MVSKEINTCMPLPILPIGFGLATAEIFIIQPDKKGIIFLFGYSIQFSFIGPRIRKFNVFICNSS